MTEQEPQPERIYLQHGEHRLELQPDKTAIFLHGERFSAYDHIWVYSDATGDEDESGLVYFRQVVTNFDEFVGNLRQRDFPFIEKEEPSDGDRECYRNTFDCDPAIPPKTYELGQRHVALIKRLGETMTAMPDDLLYTELTSEHNRSHTERWID